MAEKAGLTAGCEHRLHRPGLSAGSVRPSQTGCRQGGSVFQGRDYVPAGPPRAWVSAERPVVIRPAALRKGRRNNEEGP